MTLKFGRRAFIAAAAAIGLAGPVTAGGHQVLDSVHFLIPGGAGGGWDGTAPVSYTHLTLPTILLV